MPPLWKASSQEGKPKAPWVLRMPQTFQINSSLIFIAFMAVIVGLAALLGFSDPQSITSKMPLPFYKVWGGVNFMTGVFLIAGIIRRDLLLEKFTARILSMGLVAFALWALAANGLSRSVVTLALSAVIVFLLEQRISLINVLLYARKLAGRGEKREEE